MRLYILISAVNQARPMTYDQSEARMRASDWLQVTTFGWGIAEVNKYKRNPKVSK